MTGLIWGEVLCPGKLTTPLQGAAHGFTTLYYIIAWIQRPCAWRSVWYKTFDPNRFDIVGWLTDGQICSWDGDAGSRGWNIRHTIGAYIKAAKTSGHRHNKTEMKGSQFVDWCSLVWNHFDTLL